MWRSIPEFNSICNLYANPIHIYINFTFFIFVTEAYGMGDKVAVIIQHLFVYEQLQPYLK